MNGEGDWAESYKKAIEFVPQLTLPEKVNLTTGSKFLLLHYLTPHLIRWVHNTNGQRSWMAGGAMCR